VAAADELLEGVAAIRSDRRDAVLLARELTNTLQLLAHACKEGSHITEGAGDAASVATDLRCSLGDHRELWAERHRIGGLHDSARRLEEAVREYGATAR
jgi:hypothetical protein